MAIGSLRANPTQSKTITGVVTSATDNEPLIGVSVQVKETATGGITDVDGRYTVSAAQGQTLLFSYIGYEDQEIRVGASSVINVVMQEDVDILDEVVVIGYGVQKKKLVTGATAQVKGEDVAKLNTTNPLQAMQGQMPGISILSTSGQPGSDMKVTIRGLGTTGNANPLYVIDGIAGGDINTLNPSDIESIDVLKDAATAAIYGASAANGVILITTKSGKEGRAQVTFDAYYGIQNVARKAQLLNAAQYKVIMDEQALNSGNAAYNWANYKSIYDTAGNPIDTNWMDAMFKDNAVTQNYSLGVTGGGTTSTYALTLSYTAQEGVVGGKDVSNYERFNGRFNSEHKLYGDLLTVGEQISFIRTINTGIQVGNQYSNTLRGAFATSPLSPIYSDNGYNGSPYNDTSNSDWYTGDSNPYGSMMTNTNNQGRNTSFVGNLYAELRPIKGLKIRTVFGVNYGASEWRSFTPLYRFSIYTFNTTRTSASQSMYQGTRLQWTNTASYDWMWNEHALTALVGMEASRYSGTNVGSGTGTLKEGFDDWDHAYVNNGTATGSDTGMSASGSPADESREVSYFARLSWNYKETYMATANVRYDGSSRFARGHRYGAFPSISAGWALTNEAFMEDTRSWLDFFKLRVSWGQIGNSNIGNYQYAAPITSSNVYYNFGNTLGADGQANTWGAYPSRLANPAIRWETSQQFDVGFDARFLNSRLGVNFDFYIKDTKNWLVVAPILATAGANAPYINGGGVKNTGVELNLTWNDHIGRDFHYNIGINGAYNKNEVGEIPNSDGIIHGSVNMLYDNTPEFYRAQNGFPIGYYWGFKTAGIFQNEKEITDWIAAGNGVLQASPMPGDVKFVDLDHDGVVNDNDKTNLGNGMPDLTYGINLGFSYKGLDFSLLASGQAGNKIVQTYRNWTNKQANYTTAILERWTGEGTSNRIPRLTETNINWQFSDLYVHDGDFLRISNVTLGYDFSKLIRIPAISQARLYVQAQNLFTFTKYNGMDPEIGYGTDGWVAGIDVGYYPRPRTFLVGVNLKF
jgi:TonB-linked SusC/RagA family outer membrane protein